MIDTRTDFSYIEKFQYLKSSLIGNANKIKILAIERLNYSKACDLLSRAYKVKQILISRHLSLLINLPILEKKTTDSLTKLAHVAQQHVASLATLGVNVGFRDTRKYIREQITETSRKNGKKLLVETNFLKSMICTNCCTGPRFVYLTEFAPKYSSKTIIASSAKQKRISNKAFVIQTINTCAAIISNIRYLNAININNQMYLSALKL